MLKAQALDIKRHFLLVHTVHKWGKCYKQLSGLSPFYEHFLKSFISSYLNELKYHRLCVWFGLVILKIHCNKVKISPWYGRLCASGIPTRHCEGGYVGYFHDQSKIEDLNTQLLDVRTVLQNASPLLEGSFSWSGL